MSAGLCHPFHDGGLARATAETHGNTSLKGSVEGEAHGKEPKQTVLQSGHEGGEQSVGSGESEMAAEPELGTLGCRLGPSLPLPWRHAD